MFGPGVVSHMCFVLCLVAGAGLVCARRGHGYRARVLGASALRASLAIAAIVLAPIWAAYAAPESWWPTAFTVTGTEASGRFGEALACSSAPSESNNRSYFAVGAPDAVSGQGRVYIYDIDNPGSVSQTLSAPSPVNNAHFGSSMSFMKDLTGDNVDELLIGEPGNGVSQGKVHVYFSVISGVNVSWTECGSYTGATPNFGAAVLGLRAMTVGLPNIVVGGGGGGGANFTEGFEVVAGGEPVLCSFNSRAVFTSNPAGAVELGLSLAQVTNFNGSEGLPELIAGDPGRNSNDGTLFLFPSDLPELEPNTGSGGERLGAAVAGYHLSNHHAFSSTAGRGSVRIDNISYTESCSVSKPLQEASSEFGAALVHLSDRFDGPLLAREAVFGGYRSESETGGSVGIFGIAGGACSSIFQYNNCSYDAAQEQGKALAGGPYCIRNDGLSFQYVMLSGSPGHSSGLGRVDGVADGSEHLSVQPCEAPTNTPTPTATSTPTPQDGDPATATPTPTPLPIIPGQKNLPPPTVQVAGDDVTVTMPVVTPKLTGKALSKAMKLLMARGLTKQQATKALKSLVVTYVLKISNVGGASVSEVDAFGRSTIIRSRNNQISRQNLAPGNYSTSYTIQISTKKPLVPLGSTGTSRPTTFRVP